MKSTKKKFSISHSSFVIRYLVSLLLFLLPIQLGTFFFVPESYISGIRIDYLAPAIYLTDIVAIILILFNYKLILNIFFLRRFGTWSASWRIVIWAIIFLNILFAIEPMIALYKWVKIGEMAALCVIFRNTELPTRNVITAFLFGAFIQLLLVIFQVTQGHALQGFAYFLGERAFTLSTPGISKVALDGVEVLRGYGSFSHPNSLAGFYLLVYTFFLFLRNARHPGLAAPNEASRSLDSGCSNNTFGSPIGVGDDILRNSLLAICTLLILFSFSKIAIATHVLVTIFFILRNKYDCIICGFSKILVPILLALIVFSAQGDADSIEKRVYLADSALKIITQYPIFGTGLGNYLYAQSQFPIPYGYFFLQPVHNIFLLVIAEIGILPIIFILVGVMSIRQLTDQFPITKKAELKSLFSIHSSLFIRNSTFLILMVVVITGMFDHYWLTLQQNMLLLPVIFGLLQHDKHMVQ